MGHLNGRLGSDWSLPPEDITLNDFFDLHFYPFIEVRKKRPEHDRQQYDKHIRTVIGDAPIRELGNQILDDWIRQQIVKRLKPSTINKHIFLLNRVLNVATRWGIVRQNVFRDRTLQKLPTGDYKQRFLTEGEVVALLDACRRDKHPFIFLFAKLLILTGARKGEARLARWRDMDRANRIWTVPVSKSGRSRRIVLSDAADQMLDELRDRNLNLGLSVGPNDFLFINPRTGTSYDSFYAAWHRVRDMAGLPDVRIHDLRHSFASFLINKGASIYEVQQLLGHHHISMTQRYAHLLPNTLRNRVEIVSSALSETNASLFD